MYTGNRERSPRSWAGVDRRRTRSWRGRRTGSAFDGRRVACLDDVQAPTESSRSIGRSRLSAVVVFSVQGQGQGHKVGNSSIHHSHVYPQSSPLLHLCRRGGRPPGPHNVIYSTPFPQKKSLQYFLPKFGCGKFYACSKAKYQDDLRQKLRH